MTPPYPVSPPAELGIVRTLPEDLIPGRSGVMAWWSNVKREGEWVLPRIFRVFTCIGDVELDLTSARMGAGTSEIEINCILAYVTITVPPDIRVLCEGHSWGGDFDVKGIGNTTPPVDAPTLRISGISYFGAVTIRIADPNAPGFIQKLKAGWAQLKE